MRWSIAMAMIRYGHGFPDILLQGAEPDKIDEFIASKQFDNFDANRYWVHNERQTLEFKGNAQAALNPQNYYSSLLESISCGSGIPEPVLRGAQAGALTGSEVNERAYFKMVSDVQTSFEPIVRELIDKIIMFNMKVDADNIPSYEVVWHPGFELTEVEKANVAETMSRAAVNCTKFMTIDEVRQRFFNMEELPGGEGKVVLGLKAPEPQQVNPFKFDAATDAEAANKMQSSQETLGENLKKIVKNCQENKIKPEDAVISAEMVITEHIGRMKNLVRLQLEAKANKPIADLPPEIDRTFAGMQARYMDSFKRILQDAMNLQAKPSEVAAS
jgi:hypothetical protein